MNATSWTYQPPMRPDDYSNQCYYRWEASSDTEVFRFQSETATDVTLTRGPGLRVKVRLTADEIVILRDALSDAIKDIASLQVAQQARDDRAAPFDHIQNLMGDAAKTGGVARHYAHPDVHYVPADEIDAKYAELAASGCAQFLVLAEPPAGKFRP